VTRLHADPSDDLGYAQRAAFYAAEIAAVPTPVLLPELLRPGMRVAELPSGTGHFLTAYARQQADVLLIDASQGMLAAARTAAPEVVTLCQRIEDLSSADGPADLVAIPNGALNQLAVMFGPSRLLAAAARILAPGGILLAQVISVADDGSLEACGFYDPAAPSGEPVVDRLLRVEGRDLTRHRRQQVEHDVLRLDFELHDGDEVLYRHAVELLALPAGRLADAVTVASLDLLSITPGTGGFTEVLAQVPEAGPR
jgi:SAM-dependent methyltransferase